MRKILILSAAVIFSLNSFAMSKSFNIKADPVRTAAGDYSLELNYNLNKNLSFGLTGSYLNTPDRMVKANADVFRNIGRNEMVSPEQFENALEMIRTTMEVTAPMYKDTVKVGAQAYYFTNSNTENSFVVGIKPSYQQGTRVAHRTMQDSAEKRLAIPVSIGYQWHWKNFNLSTEISAGPSYDFVSGTNQTVAQASLLKIGYTV